METYTNDPDRDAAVYLAQRDEEERKWPHCDDCGETAYPYVWVVGGEFLCEDCMNNTYRHEAVQYVLD